MEIPQQNEIETFAAAVIPNKTNDDKSKLRFCLLCNNCIFSSILSSDNEDLLNTTQTSCTIREDLGSSLSSPVIKVEVDDDEGIISWQNQVDDELLAFLLKHFTIVIQICRLNGVKDPDNIDFTKSNEIFQFCASCCKQLFAYKQLQTELISLQRQCQKLKQIITSGFNKTYLARKEEAIAECGRRRGSSTSNQDNNAKYGFIPSSDEHHSMNSTTQAKDEETHTQPLMNDALEGYNWIQDPSPVGEIPEEEGEARIESDCVSDSETVRINTKGIALNEDQQSLKSNLSSSVLRPCRVVLSRIELIKNSSTANTLSQPSIPKLKLKRKQDKRKGGPFKCEFCPKQFSRKDDRNVHMRLHTGLKPYSCKYCDKAFHKGEYLRQHLISHTKTRSHVCKVCGNTYSHGSSLWSHVGRVHEGKKPIRKSRRKNKPMYQVVIEEEEVGCSTSEQFQTKKDVNHKIRNSRFKKKVEPTAICELCKLSFDNQRQLKAHCNRCHGEKKSYQCEHCGQVYSDRGNMLKHVRVVHEKQRRFACKECDALFSASSCLKLHMVQHTGEKLLGCNYCELRFNGLYSKKKHMVQVHSVVHLVEKPFVCSVCYSTYSTEAERDEHVLKLHDKFKCKVCNKTFANGTRYNVHMLIHTGEKPFVCQFCAKAFNKIENLKEHCYRHTGERPHKCAVQHCNQGFLRKKELAIHMQKVHLNNSVQHAQDETEDQVGLPLPSLAGQAALDVNFVLNNNPTLVAL